MFIGAAQFGKRAQYYYNHFYLNPKNIVKIICKAVDLGVTGIQVLPYPPILKALKNAEMELNEKLTVVAPLDQINP